MGNSRTVEEWIDVLSIREVISRYTSLVNRDAWDEFDALWAPDAEWVLGPPLNTTLRGAPAVRESLLSSLDGNDFFLQMTHDSDVTLHGEGRASATTAIHAMARRPGHHEVRSYGIYYDDFVKIDDSWKFAKRRMVPIYMDPSPLPGQAPTPRSGLA